MAIYEINTIIQLFKIDNEIDFVIEEDGYVGEENSEGILKVPPRINICNYLNNSGNSITLVDSLIVEYIKFKCPLDPIMKIELKGGIYFQTQEIQYKNTLSMLLANMIQRQGSKLYTRVFMGKEGLYQKKYGRYNPLKIKLDILKNILVFLAKADYIDLYYNTRKSKFETRFKVNKKLTELFKKFEISHENVLLSENTSLIELGIEKVKKNGTKTKLLIDFEDTDETRKRENILKDYNHILLYWKSRINFKKSMPHIIYAKCKYNNNMARGGRIYAPWQWGEISSSDRLKFKIDNSIVVEVDLKSCSLRIACHILGFNPKQEDLYDIENSKYPREHIKYTIQQMLNMNCKDNRTLLQKLVDVSNGLDLKTTLKTNDSSYIKKLAEDIYNYYNSDEMNNLSSKMFFKDKGMTDIMRIETAVVFDVIEYFTAKDEIILTIHDSYIVKEHLKDELIEIIKNSYYKHTNFEPILTVESIKSSSCSSLSHKKLREMLLK